MITPLGAKLLVRLDPIVMMTRGLYLPDQKFIRLCERCHQRAEALTDHPRCPAGTDDFGYDPIHDRTTFLGIDYSHKIVTVVQPVVPSMTRIGTVLVTGPRTRWICAGERIVIDHTAGGSLDDTRIIPEEAVLATVEEE